MENEDNNTRTWEIKSDSLDLNDLGVADPQVGSETQKPPDEAKDQEAPDLAESQDPKSPAPESAQESAGMPALTLGTIEHLAPGIAREINTPIQYVGDNVRFLKDAFKDLEALMEKHTDLLEAVRSGKSSEEDIRKVDEAREKADWDYLSDEVPHAIAQTLDGVDKVCKIVHALTDFFNPSKDAAMALDLNQAIESTVTVMRSEWKYVAEVVMDLDTYLPCVTCTPEDFNQVVLHLMINATHSLQEKLGEDPVDKGEIHITTKEDGRWVEIRFQDDGGGLPFALQETFLNGPSSTDGSGGKMGLDLCRSLIEEKYGGSIKFETDPAKGTTFIIRMRHK